MTHLYRLLAAVAFSAVAIVAALAVLPVDAQAHQSGARLDGTWLTQIRIRDCASEQVVAGPFPGVIAFHKGGTVSETGPSLPMSARGPAHGTWERAGDRGFNVKVIFQRFDLNGFYMGTQMIRAHLTLAGDARSYVAAGTFELQDALGAPIGSGCSLVNGTRF
jgi:hypothetical protein